MPYFVDRDNEPLTKDEDIVSKFVELFLWCAKQRTMLEDRWFKNEKLYAGYIDPTTWPYRSRISVKRIWEYTNTEKARLYQAVLAPKPPFHVMGVSEDDPDRTIKIQQFMLWQWEEGMNFYDEFNRLILTGLIYGFAPYSMDWRQKFGYVPERIPYRLKDGSESGKITINRKRPIYLGAGFYAEDPYAFYYDLRVNRWSELPFIFRRLIAHYDDLQDLQDRKIFENVKELRGANNQLITTDFNQRVNDALGPLSGLEWQDFDTNGDIELIEGYFPAENRLIIIAGGNKIVYDDDIPLINAEHPFGCWTNFGSLWGIKGWATPEVGEDQQHEINFIRNAMMDNRNMCLNPMWLRSKTAGIMDEDMTWQPGCFIDTFEMKGLEQLKVQDTWTQQGLASEGQCDNDLERQLGLNRQGIQPVPRETVPSVNTRAEALGILFGDKVQGLVGCLRNILRKQHRLNRQFLKKSQFVRVMQKEVPGYLEVGPEDIVRDYDFIIEPTASYGNRSMRKEEWVQFAQIHAAIPGLAAVTKWAGINEQICEEFDIRNPRKIIITTDEAQAQAVAAGKGGTPAGQGQSPQGGAPAPQGPNAGAPAPEQGA